MAASPPASSAAGKMSAAFAQRPQALPLSRCSHRIIPGQTPLFTVGFGGEPETAQMRVKRLVRLAVLERENGVMKDRAIDRDCRDWSWATLWLRRRRNDFVEKDLKTILYPLLAQRRKERLAETGSGRASRSSGRFRQLNKKCVQS
jgi:hypothetical protein